MLLNNASWNGIVLYEISYLGGLYLVWLLDGVFCNFLLYTTSRWKNNSL